MDEGRPVEKAIGVAAGKITFKSLLMLAAAMSVVFTKLSCSCCVRVVRIKLVCWSSLDAT
jgi:hypothetical protein